MRDSMSNARTAVEVSLSETVDDHSRAQVCVEATTDEIRVSNTLSMNAHADPETSDVWLAMRFHSYTSLDWREPSISRGISILEHRFSREEMESLVEILSHELEKLRELATIGE